jgi:predicted O-methyltransferase YrrM
MRQAVLRSPLGRLSLIPYRYWSGRRYLAPSSRALRRWVLTSREYTNFTYDLEWLNECYLAAFVAHVTGHSVQEIESYFEELQSDEQLRTHICRTIASHPSGRFADPPKYGKRLAWYAFARALKPSLVVETGVDKGLGACVLASALLRNAEEGSPGRYLGTDINPRAGYLLSGRYSEAGTIAYGDSIETLKQLDDPIDMFINDSDHSADYERREYETVQATLAPSAVVVADNAHANAELFRFAQRTARTFLFFREQPKEHWYPGGGIGVAFTR